MFTQENFENWHWVAATALSIRSIRRIHPLLNSACGLGRDDGWEIECTLSLAERMCTLSPHSKKEHLRIIQKAMLYILWGIPADKLQKI